MKFKICILLGVLYCAVTCSVSANTWNYFDVQGFGDGTMPDGDIYGNTDVWSYLYNSTGNLNPEFFQQIPYYLTRDSAEGYDAWHLGVKTGPWQLFECYIGALHVAPSYQNDVFIAFKSPIAMTVDVSISLTNWSYDPPNSQSNGQYFYLMHNDSVLAGKYNPAGGTTAFSINDLELKEDDYIYFGIQAYANNQGWDGVRINELTIRSIPEPASVILMLISICPVLMKPLGVMKE